MAMAATATAVVSVTTRRSDRLANTAESLTGAVPASSNGGSCKRRQLKVGGYAMMWGCCCEEGRKGGSDEEDDSQKEEVRPESWSAAQHGAEPTRAGMGRLGGSGEEQGSARDDGRRLQIVTTRGHQRKGHGDGDVASNEDEGNLAVRVHRRNPG